MRQCRSELVPRNLPKIIWRGWDDIAYDTHTTADNGYIVTGETTSGTSTTRDGFIMKVRKNGAISWSKTMVWRIVVGSQGWFVLYKLCILF